MSIIRLHTAAEMHDAVHAGGDCDAASWHDTPALVTAAIDTINGDILAVLQAAIKADVLVRASVASVWQHQYDVFIGGTHQEHVSLSLDAFLRHWAAVKSGSDDAFTRSLHRTGCSRHGPASASASDADSCMHLYLSQVSLDDALLPIASSTAPWTAPRVCDRSRIVASRLWINTYPAVSATHYDSDPNIVTVISGRKIAALIAPSCASHLKARDVWAADVHMCDLHDVFSDVAVQQAVAASCRDAGVAVTANVPNDILACADALHTHVLTVSVPVTAHPEVRKRARGAADSFEIDFVIVPAGSALYIPEGWWHCVWSEQCTVAVNHWYEGLRAVIARATQAVHKSAWFTRTVCADAGSAHASRLLASCSARAASVPGYPIDLNAPGVHERLLSWHAAAAHDCSKWLQTACIHELAALSLGLSSMPDAAAEAVAGLWTAVNAHVVMPPMAARSCALCIPSALHQSLLMDPFPSRLEAALAATERELGVRYLRSLLGVDVQ